MVRPLRSRRGNFASTEEGNFVLPLARPVTGLDNFRSSASEGLSLRSEAIMKIELKPVIEALKHDGNQLEHHARKLRTTSPNLKAEAEEIDDRVASIRKQIEILEQW